MFEHGLNLCHLCEKLHELMSQFCCNSFDQGVCFGCYWSGCDLASHQYRHSRPKYLAWKQIKRCLGRSFLRIWKFACLYAPCNVICLICWFALFLFLVTPCDEWHPVNKDQHSIAVGMMHCQDRQRETMREASAYAYWRMNFRLKLFKERNIRSWTLALIYVNQFKDRDEREKYIHKPALTTSIKLFDDATEILNMNIFSN